MKTRLEILEEQKEEAQEHRSKMWQDNTERLRAIEKAIEEEMCRPTPRPGDKFYIEVEVQEDNFAIATVPAGSIIVKIMDSNNDNPSYYMRIIDKSKLIPIK